MYNEDISVKNENKITNLSVVLNGVDVMKNSYSYKYGYGYGYGYGGGYYSDNPKPNGGIFAKYFKK
jgi:hypothetical protein